MFWRMARFQAVKAAKHLPCWSFIEVCASWLGDLVRINMPCVISTMASVAVLGAVLGA